MKKRLNIIRCILLGLILFFLIINIATFLWNYRIVAIVSDNKIGKTLSRKR